MIRSGKVAPYSCLILAKIHSDKKSAISFTKVTMPQTTRPTLSAIVAMAENRVIGYHNQLPWHFPADLKRFKAITSGHCLLMGRKTHQSIGRPLPQRTNMVLTRDPLLHIPGCLTVHTVAQALHWAAQHHHTALFIIGGAAVYAHTLPQVQQIYLTLIHHPFRGDTYFPLLNHHLWQEAERVTHAADDHHAHAYSFIRLIRQEDG
jgi:dihydrofolate reductase